VAALTQWSRPPNKTVSMCTPISKTFLNAYHTAKLWKTTKSFYPEPGGSRSDTGSNDRQVRCRSSAYRYLVVKNSWGTNRPDRGLSDGYTRFNMDFLNRPLPFGLEHGESDISKGRWYSALSGFVLPPKYRVHINYKRVCCVKLSYCATGPF
jgi:hypothetical protein